jgi:hypothetical protein
MKRWLIFNVLYQIRAARNYLDGFAFDAIHRCRDCGHTIYAVDECRRKARHS